MKNRYNSHLKRQLLYPEPEPPDPLRDRIDLFPLPIGAQKLPRLLPQLMQNGANGPGKPATAVPEGKKKRRRKPNWKASRAGNKNWDDEEYELSEEDLGTFRHACVSYL